MFQPGQSGNPRGRKPDTPVTKELRRLAKQKAEAKATARAAFDIAQNPENGQAIAALKTILDRVEGPVVQESRIAVATIAYVSHLEREET